MDIRGLSAYLNLEDTDALDPRHSLYVEYLLRVRDQIKRKHHEQFEGNIFSSDDDGSGTWGFPALIPLTKLYDKKQGYIVNGAMILEVQISLITEVVNVQAKARSSTKQQFPFSRTSSEMGSNNFILNETVNEERYPKGWVIGKKRKVVNVDVDERIGVEEMNRKDGEIVDGLNDLQFQLVQERSKRAEVERENAVLQDRVSMLMNMLQENKKLDDQP
ncbi:MATH domain and coiled-coil domain-containing protein At3g58210-like isoform X2 [Euphorbia lathyris]|uniref:MATH domain and coiled-coil domain-containing protein At3g58210-like isoform X2 n=1 Tax=Euphorbia lathyris TaxID=212925 RepID=UPI0033136668